MRKCKNKHETKAKALKFNGNDNCLFIVEQTTLNSYIMNLENAHKWFCESQQTLKRWDAVTTFKPPPELSIENGNIFKIEKLDETSPEYILLAEQFLGTLQGPPPKTSGLFGGGKLKNLDVEGLYRKGPKKGGKAGGFGMAAKFRKPPKPGFRVPPNNVNPGFYAGGGIFGRPNNNMQGNRIHSIEKIYNCVLYEKFINELRRMIRKYPNKNINEIVKHLFHGCGATDPKIIYGGEDGLDIRFSNAGAYGQGIYFANNSAYSTGFSHPTKKGTMQMFVGLVCTGDSVQQPGGNYRIPPLKKGSKTERYDSINNGPGGGHFIVYDNVKVYPGYLITFGK
jgi:hypothetical protein